MSARTAEGSLTEAVQLSIRRQCVLLGMARSGVYRPPSAATNDNNLVLRRQIDELFTAWPFHVVLSAESTSAAPRSPFSTVARWVFAPSEWRACADILRDRFLPLRAGRPIL